MDLRLGLAFVHLLTVHHETAGSLLESAFPRRSTDTSPADIFNVSDPPEQPEKVVKTHIQLSRA